MCETNILSLKSMHKKQPEKNEDLLKFDKVNAKIK